MKRFTTIIIFSAVCLMACSQNTENADSIKMEFLKELLESKPDNSKDAICNSKDVEYKYFFKRKSLGEGYYLELKPVTKKDSIAKEKYGQSIEDRDLFVSYPNDQKIEILRELLMFQGDTSISDKMYKIKTPDLTRIQIQPFTIQIEALYTFSRILLIGLPYFQPKLTDKKEKKNYNGRQPVVDEIYGIYRQWLDDAIEKDFKNLNLPMSGTKYQWEGQKHVTEKWFIDFHRSR